MTVPLPVFATSYENAKGYEPLLGPRPQHPICGTNNARAYADFLQEGQLSMFVHGTPYDSTTPGTMCFWRRTAQGSWINATQSVLSDARGCIHPRKAIVADFNKDGRPDVFTACHGYDRPPWSGEQSLLLLSTASGSYDRIALPDIAYAHGAAAGDLNGDGLPDILFLSTTKREYYIYLNIGNGAFVRDNSRLPNASIWGKGYYTAELLDIDGDGHLDAFLAGAELPPENAASIVMWGDAGGHFTSRGTWTFPTECELTLDITLLQGNAFLLKECDAYSGFVVHKVQIRDGSATVVYSARTAGYVLDWLFVSQGRLVSDDPLRPLTVTP